MTPVDDRPTLHVPQGLPGSGKTTVALELAAQGAVHVELDEVRRRVWPECPPSWDPYSGPGLRVHLAWEAEVLEHLAAGRDVCADRTFLDPRALQRLRGHAPQARVVVHDLRHVPLATCIARDAARPAAARVGEAGIRSLWGRWLAPGGSHAAGLPVRQNSPEKAPGRPPERLGGLEGPRRRPDP